MTKVIDAESFNHTTSMCGRGRLEDESREYLWHDADEYVGGEEGEGGGIFWSVESDEGGEAGW